MTADQTTPVRVVEAEALAGLDPAAFNREIMAPCQPVLLRGVCRAWPVRQKAEEGWASLAAYLQWLDAGRAGEAFIGAPAIAGRYDYGRDLEGFNFQRESLPLGRALQRIAAAAADPGLDSVYLGSLPADDYVPAFAAENPVGFLPPTARPRLWLGNASHVACHYDAFDNLACLVAGRRRFTLYPPDAIGDLYVGPIDHTMAGQSVSLAAGAPPDDPRYPRFAAASARALIVELEPGDGLYLPKLWWHQVEALEPFNVLMNYWWNAAPAHADTPMNTLLHGLLSLRDRPDFEKQAWKAMFDYYVFGPADRAGAHLPVGARGPLGPMDAMTARRLRAQLLDRLNR